MRKTVPVAISMSAALILVLVAIEMRTQVETVKAEGLDPTPQHVPFLWLTPTEESHYPTYKRVEGGKHADGTMMYVCRFMSIPGKLYTDGCHYSDGGWEYVRNAGYQVLVNDGGYVWTPVDQVSRSQIKKRALVGGENAQDPSDTIYICRKKRADGVHPGKYSYKNNYCYIPWGNKEIYFTKGYDILFFP